MSAVSPFAPTGRNVFFRSTSGQISRPTNLRRISCFALLIIVWRFWRNSVVLRHMKRDVDARLDQLQKSVLARVGGLRLFQSVASLLRINFFLSKLNKVLVPRSPHPSPTTEDVDAVHSIISFWFAQHAPDTAQKKLWMVASASTEYMRRIDMEISDRYSHTVADLAAGGWTRWCAEPFGYQGKLAAIVALDQFSRHIHRHLTNGSCPIPAQEHLDSLAFEIAKMFATDHRQEIDCGVIPLPMQIFALMPYRHAGSAESIGHVQLEIETMSSLQEQMQKMVQRFRKATNRRMAVVQDELRRTGGVGQREAGSIEDGDILEVFPFDADMAAASDHIVTRTVISFLADRGVHPGQHDPAHGSCSPVIVSLSGGVDSMVIAFVLSYLKRSLHYSLDVSAIHIDYANRPESGAEAAYVKRYCNNLGIQFTCRRIDEVTRGVTGRDQYERISREARYNAYRHLARRSKEKHDDDIEVGVMLGHHRGDLRENVLSNAHKGSGPLDLSGMTAVSTNDGVTIYRPLLLLEKREIFDFAHKFGVPYFKDTT